MRFILPLLLIGCINNPTSNTYPKLNDSDEDTSGIPDDTNEYDTNTYFDTAEGNSEFIKPQVDLRIVNSTYNDVSYSLDGKENTLYTLESTDFFHTKTGKHLLSIDTIEYPIQLSESHSTLFLVHTNPSDNIKPILITQSLKISTNIVNLLDNRCPGSEKSSSFWAVTNGNIAIASYGKSSLLAYDKINTNITFYCWPTAINHISLEKSDLPEIETPLLYIMTGPDSTSYPYIYSLEWRGNMERI